MKPRNLLLGVALALGACAHAPRPATPPPYVAPRNPLVVTFVVDQFAAWIADERLALLPEDGGFARLRREGTWFRHQRYAHAATDTAPGHSSLYTARPPRESGILANEVPDAQGHRVSILRDEATHIVGPDGVTDGVGSSIARLRVETLADALRAQRPEAVIVSISLKDRGAIFGGGRHPTATLWFDPSRDAFVTSTAFGQTLPTWAREHGVPTALQALRAQPWTLTDEAWVRAHALTPDDQPGEGDLDGWGTVFPHDFARARRPAGALRASPYGDEAVLRLAEDAVRAVRDPSKPMLLALSLSSNDYVGHLFGPDSWEAWDQLRRLDASLGRFFRTLDTLAGPSGWSAVLSADHGIITLPEAAASARPWCATNAPDAFQRPCTEPLRLDPDEVAGTLQTAAVAALGPGRWVLGVADPYVYLTPEAEALEPARKRQLLDALVARARQYPAVERVLETYEVPERCPEGDAVEALLCRSIPSRSGAALYLQARAGSFFDAGYALGRGTSHGAPYLFDRTVPLLVRAPGAAEPGAVVDDPVPFRTFRAQAERLLGLTPEAR